MSIGKDEIDSGFQQAFVQTNVFINGKKGRPKGTAHTCMEKQKTSAQNYVRMRNVRGVK